ncbi:MAG: GNAT family N-acetyltransferase [Candidatus Latescibacteria bacterium]|nr:GNAT family N-acetyltransferase [Candidatus Latescibacterota bacterium]
MTADQLTIRPPVQETDGEAIYQLQGSHWPGMEYVARRGRVAHSHLDWDVSRIGLDQQRLVAYWGVYKLHMRIGQAQVKTAGINLPITHSDWRGQGHMPRLLANSEAAQKASGYGLSVINLTHAYFFRFGYVFAWPETSFTIETEALPDTRPDLELVQVNAYDLMGRLDLAQLYNQQNATVTGTCQRPTYPRSKHPGTDYEPGYLIVDKGTSAGYFSTGRLEAGKRLFVDDSAGDTQQRLCLLAQLARRHQCPQVHFSRLSYNSEMAIQLRRRNCLMETEYRHDGGYLVRIIDLQTTLQALLPELTQRLQKTSFYRWSGALSLQVEEQQAALIFDRGQIHLEASAQTEHRLQGDQHLAQLIVGTYPPLETIAAGHLHLSGRAGELVEALFPAQHPQMPNEDL